MKTENLTYRDSGTVFKSVLVYDENLEGKRPGVIVFPDAYGVIDHTIDRAKMLARMGYVALAADPYGEGRTADNLEKALALIGDMLNDRTKIRSRARAALTALSALPQVDTHRIAAIGFCLGGSFVLEMARDGAPLACVVSFHGQLDTPMPAKPGAIKTKILVCHGSEDPIVPDATLLPFVNEMRAAGGDWQLNAYGGTMHSFTNPNADTSLPGLAYNERSDKRSWAAMTALFDEVFNASATVP